MENVWLPHIQVKKLWNVESRALINSEEVVAHWKCTSNFIVVSTFNIEISCDLDYANYPFDRQVWLRTEVVLDTTRYHKVFFFSTACCPCC